MSRKEDELFVRVGPYRRTIMLPGVLSMREVASAALKVIASRSSSNDHQQKAKARDLKRESMERATRYSDLFGAADHEHGDPSDCAYCPICSVITVVKEDQPRGPRTPGCRHHELIVAAGILLEEAEEDTSSGGPRRPSGRYWRTQQEIVGTRPDRSWLSDQSPFLDRGSPSASTSGAPPLRRRWSPKPALSRIAQRSPPTPWPAPRRSCRSSARF